MVLWLLFDAFVLDELWKPASKGLLNNIQQVLAPNAGKRQVRVFCLMIFFFASLRVTSHNVTWMCFWGTGKGQTLLSRASYRKKSLHYQPYTIQNMQITAQRIRHSAVPVASKISQTFCAFSYASFPTFPSCHPLRCHSKNVFCSFCCLFSISSTNFCTPLLQEQHSL